jgi:hypothetical protein
MQQWRAIELQRHCRTSFEDIARLPIARVPAKAIFADRGSIRKAVRDLTENEKSGWPRSCAVMRVPVTVECGGIACAPRRHSMPLRDNDRERLAQGATAYSARLPA